MRRECVVKHLFTLLDLAPIANGACFFSVGGGGGSVWRTCVHACEHACLCRYVASCLHDLRGIVSCRFLHRAQVVHRNVCVVQAARYFYVSLMC